MLTRFLDWFDGTRFWKWLSKNYLAHITFRVMGYTKFPMEDYFKITDLGEPGDILAFCSQDKDSLAAAAIRWAVKGKTYFTHAGFIILDGDRGTRAVHMKGKGLLDQTLLEVLRESDYFYVGKISWKNAEAKALAHERIDSLLKNKDKIEYDFEQNLRRIPFALLKEKVGKTFYIYCSELFHAVCDGLVDIELEPKIVLGRKAYDPDSVMEDTDTLYTNHPDLKGGLLLSEAQR